MKSRAVTTLVMLLLGASLLYAHDLFIKLDSYFVKPYTSVRIPVLNGTFNLSANSITRERLRDVTLVSEDGRVLVPIVSWDAEGDTTYLTVEAERSATYVLGISTRSTDFDLEADAFNEYLEHDGIPDVLETRRRNGELDKAVRERYSKHVKAVLQVGNRRTPGYKVELGYPAEIVPVDSPYLAQVGSRLRFRCLVDGIPVVNQFVIAGGEHDAEHIEWRGARTNADGVVSFVIDSPGKWYIKFINMVPSTDLAIDYESKWATLTFEIR